MASMTLRQIIADAYHEHHCGTPPSCGVGPRTYCDGKIEPKLLDKLAKRATAYLAIIEVTK